ncbi:hypothetical protein [Bradyrhizobium japonicum]|uniref:hypothetical protein n=1 Tax=Bradyrhizobium japonicum TaxID=375 RepID=UPI002714E375|nr:hypothetical protein [Bradyrhizobium japonicum]WLB57434.1 hypothetical protein QIH94_16020 [Bradyrhizobium japonicum]
MVGLFPDTVTFSTLLGVEAPNILIKRDGYLRPESPNITHEHVMVLLQHDPKGGFTLAQYRAMAQLSRIALRQNPFARIVFDAGASPWSLDCLPGYDERRTTVTKAMRIRPARIAKVWVRRKPLHPAITQRQTKSRRTR